MSLLFADFQLQGFFHKTERETGLVRQDGCVVYLFAVHLGGLIHYSSQGNGTVSKTGTATW